MNGLIAAADLDHMGVGDQDASPRSRPQGDLKVVMGDAF